MSSQTFGFKANVGPLSVSAAPCRFAVEASGPNWKTACNFQIFDYSALIFGLMRVPFFQFIWNSYAAAFTVVAEGAFWRYVKISWRFSLFFLFPFLLMAAGAAVAIIIASAPYWVGLFPALLSLTIPIAVLGFRYVFLPFAERFYLFQTLALWQLAIKVALINDAHVNRMIDEHVAGLEAFFAQDADEYLVTSFSLGAAFMVHALGLALERTPHLLNGKSVGIVTLGGPGLQCSLLANATVMRSRLRTILAQKNVLWLDVQNKSDVVNFYSGQVARDNEFADLAEPAVKIIRTKNMLTPKTYKASKWDPMRVHRQFVYGSERRSQFDFILLTAGPFSLHRFLAFSEQNLPPLGSDGDLIG